MAITKVLSRDCVVELNTGTIAVPIWTQLNGIESLTYSPSKQSAATTTWEDEGEATHLPASRSRSFSITGKRLEDESNGDRDPGQEAAEAWGELMGAAGLKQTRITSPGGQVIGPFLGSATVTPLGGGGDDAANWQLDIEVSGPLNP